MVRRSRRMGNFVGPLHRPGRCAAPPRPAVSWHTRSGPGRTVAPASRTALGSLSCNALTRNNAIPVFDPVRRVPPCISPTRHPLSHAPRAESLSVCMHSMYLRTPSAGTRYIRPGQYRRPSSAPPGYRPGSRQLTRLQTGFQTGFRSMYSAQGLPGPARPCKASYRPRSPPLFQGTNARDGLRARYVMGTSNTLGMGVGWLRISSDDRPSLALLFFSRSIFHPA